MNTFESICNRKSIRSFTGELITDDELTKIHTAANAAPVGMNDYDSMYLSIITNKDLLLRIDKNAGEFMKKPDSHPLYGAPILVVISSKFTPFSEAESDPIKMAAKFNSDNIAHSNAAIIAHNMALEAVELGVGSCYIWGAIFALNANKALLKELNLPNGCLPCCALALGKTDITYEPRTIPNDRIKYQIKK